MAERTAARECAYEAFDSGDLEGAAAAFEQLRRQDPHDASLHYMAGLAAKYRGDWRVSMEANLAALEREADDEAARWNAAIAATALGEWAAARAQWQALGIPMPGQAGPIEGDFGLAKLRLNPWGKSESVYGTRIDPVRMRIENVPLPESGHRFGDLMLNDGASLGTYPHGGRNYNVFNALQRLQVSPFATHAVFVQVRDAAALAPLLESRSESIGLVEDWTRTLGVLCLRCSYGVPHRHADGEDEATAEWRVERTLGIAATSLDAVQALLEDWKNPGRGRRVERIETREFPLPERITSWPWWRAPDREE
jgi:hypothetical protein